MTSAAILWNRGAGGPEPTCDRGAGRDHCDRRGAISLASRGGGFARGLEPVELFERLRHQIGPEVFAAQFQQTPVPPGGAISVGLAALLGHAAGTYLPHKDHPKLGHRRQGWRPERLVGLHDVDAGRQSFLSDRPYARTLRVSTPQGHSDCTGAKASSALHIDRRCFDRHRTLTGTKEDLFRRA